MANRHPKRARREAIIGIISRRDVRSQAELQTLLRDSGLQVNQATLSRDLRALGVLKGPNGYAIPSGDEVGEVTYQDLPQSLKQWVTSVLVAQNQVLLKTPPAGAQVLAIIIDRSHLPLVLGTVAGDDTVLVVCEDTYKARQLAAEFEEML